MKPLIIALMFQLLTSLTLVAQLPQGFKYQAILRNSEGEVLANTNVFLRISITSQSENGDIVYSEEHETSTTSGGLILINIGEGNALSGIFSEINWGSAQHFITLELNYNNSGYTEMGSSPLLSVPYALHAETVSNTNDADADPTNEIQTLSISGDTINLSNGGSIIIKHPDTFSGNYEDLANTPTPGGDASGSIDNISVDKIKGMAVSSNIPANGQVLKWNETEQKWMPDEDGLGAAGTMDGVVSSVGIEGSETKTMTLTRSNGLGALKANFNVNDADADPNNEIQTLSFSNDTLYLSKGGAVKIETGAGFSGSYNDLSDIPENIDTDASDDFSGDYNDLANKPVLKGDVAGELDSAIVTRIQGQNFSAGQPENGQVLKWNGSAWAPGSDAVVGGSGTDGVVETMSVTTSGTTKTITLGLSSSAPTQALNANFTDEVNDADADATNEIQDISFTGTELSISSGSTVDLAPLQDGTGTDDQNLVLTDNVLSIENGTGSVDLSTYIDDADADATNEIQDLSLVGNTLKITNNSTASEIDLSTYLDNTDTTLNEQEVDAFVANNGYQLAIDDKDIDDKNELQKLSIIGDTISLDQNGGNVVIPSKGWGGVTDKALFAVTNTKGDTVFAVYEGGVLITVDQSQNKGSRSGFAVASRSAAKGVGEDILTVTKESVNIVLDTTNTKGTRSGFAVASRSAAKGEIDILNVSNDSVRIYIDESTATKGTRSGFAVASRSAAKGAGEDILTISKESVNIIIDTNATKGTRSGFAVASRSAAKSGVIDMFNINDDSVRIYIDDANKKGTRSGFAVASRSAAKGSSSDILTVSSDSTRIYVGDENAGFGVENTSATNSGRLLRLTADNYFIGHKSGINTTPSPNSSAGKHNSFFGYQTGIDNTTGHSNVFIGKYAGKGNQTGNANCFIGNYTGNVNTVGEYNVFVGDEAGMMNSSGSSNVFLGTAAGTFSKTGIENVFIGSAAGSDNNSGSYNVYMGSNAGSGMGETSGNNNVFIGYQAGSSVNSASDNVFLGYMSGRSNNSGDRNVFIGKESGYTNSSGIDNVFIGHKAGNKNSEGSYNVFVGEGAGDANTTGDDNVFIGRGAGNKNISGGANTFIGSNCGMRNTTGEQNTFVGWSSGSRNTEGSYNSFFGQRAGIINTTGENNSFFGAWCGFYNETGKFNTFMGSLAGYRNTDGHSNTFIGNAAGYGHLAGGGNTYIGQTAGMQDTSGTFNTFLGCQTGYDNLNGKYNVYLGAIASTNNMYGSNNINIGFQSGYNSTSGSNNVYIGHKSGFEAKGSNQLIIENSDADSTQVLIYGEFDNDILAFNASVGIGKLDPLEKLDINGGIKIGTTTNTNSGTIRFTGSSFQGYTGSTWQTFGDITGVTAGNGLTGGGTSGTPTLNIGAGTGIDVTSTSISVDVTDILGTGLIESSNKIGVYSLMASDGGPTHALYVDPTGDVGIGTTSPGNHRLSVTSNNTGTGKVNSTLFAQNSGSGIAAAFENYNASNSELAALIVHWGTGDILRLDSYHGNGSTDWDDEFRFTNDGIGYCDGSWQGGGADFAEYFETVKDTSEYNPGDIMIIGSKGYSADVSKTPYSQKILGVYSDNPAIVGNSDMNSNAGKVLVGLIGVVETKVTNENGTIAIGDFITTSSKEGVGMKATQSGMVVGRALEPLNEDIGKIKIFVNVHWAELSLKNENESLTQKTVSLEDKISKLENEMKELKNMILEMQK